MEIVYYINLFVRHLDISEVFSYDNRQKFKGTLLVFLKKHNIKLINGYSRKSLTQRLVKQANAILKDKIRKLQTINGSSV